MNGLTGAARRVFALVMSVVGMTAASDQPPAAAPPAEPAPAACPEPPPPDDVRTKVPIVRKPQRPGFFPILPTGKGYYSLAEVLQGNFRDGPPKYPYPRFAMMPPSLFDVDFRYLDNPKNTETDF